MRSGSGLLLVSLLILCPVFTLFGDAFNYSHPINVTIIGRPTDLGKAPQPPPAQSKSMGQFPPDFMSDQVRNNGGVIVHFLILVYCCLALAVVCDSYFVPALQFISDALSLPPDISGATFMAIGTSSPELFSSIIGVFITGDDIGTGTIIGSAVFNLLGIPAACGFAVWAWSSPSAPTVQINRFPILRDCIFYTISIVILILSIKDNKVDWIESSSLVFLFCIYVTIMYFNTQIINSLPKASKSKEKSSHRFASNKTETETTPLLLKGSVPKSGCNGYRLASLSVSQEEDSENVREEREERMGNGYNRLKQTHDSTRSREVTKELNDERDKEGEEEDEEEECEDWITSNLFMKYLMFPATLVFRVTLPKPTKFCFVLTFAFSVFWIGLLTYLSVWMVTIIGFTLGIPSGVSGITILAVGTSVPELISSVIVIKKSGLADMAICNAIGSNIFDILVCLGVPWLLKNIINASAGRPSLVAIQSSALPLTAVSLLTTILALLITFKATNWRLGRTTGIACLIIYAIFVVVATTLEFAV